MKNTLIKKGTLRARIWAMLTVIVMIVSLIAPGSKLGKVNAATQGYSVTIKFFQHDKTTPKNPGNVGDDFYLIVTAKNTDHPNWMCYAVKKVGTLNAASTPISIDKGEFRIDKYDDDGNFTGNDRRDNSMWSWMHNYQGYYDVSEGYYIDTIRLYRLKDGVTETYPPIADMSISKDDLINNYFDNHAPEGYEFLSASSVKTNDSGEVWLYDNAFTTTYVPKVIQDTPSAITEDDAYFIFVDVLHSDNTHTYYLTPLVTDGSSANTEFTIDSWCDSNGNPKPNVKYTASNAPNTTIKVLKAENPSEFSYNNAINGAKCSEVTNVNDYKLSISQTEDKDEAAYTDTFYGNINLTKISATSDYNFLTVLGPAVDYGVVASKITHDGHSETNLATKVYDNTKGENFDPDLSGNGSDQVPGVCLFGEVVGEKVRFGSTTPPVAYAIVGSDDASKIKNEAEPGAVVVVPTDKQVINNTVDSMISHMQTVSADMLSKPATLQPYVSNTENRLIVDTMGFPDDATIYVDADAYIDNYISKGKVNIKKKPNQLVVFNFKNERTEPLTIKTVRVDWGEGYKTSNTETRQFNSAQNNYADLVARQVVWNLAGIKGDVSIIESGGMFLQPNSDSGDFEAGGTSCGWVITAGDAILGKGGQEFHFVYQGLNSAGKVILKAKKIVDGVIPSEEQVFKFGVERFDSTTNKFKTVKVSTPDGDKDLVIKNTKESITIPVTEMTEKLEKMRGQLVLSKRILRSFMHTLLYRLLNRVKLK